MKNNKMKNSEVAQNFSWGQEAKANNFFCEFHGGKLVLYSYGSHFPMSIMLKDNTLLFNGDGYSMTTSQHKGLMARGLGFSNFKDLVEKTPKELILDTEQLKQIIYDNEINSHADFIAKKL